MGATSDVVAGAGFAIKDRAGYGTRKHPIVKTWVEQHPRFHLHLTPTYSSWLNLVERFFGYVTADLLQRSDHRRVQALEGDIRKWVKAWNADPKPFVSTRPPSRSSAASADLSNDPQIHGRRVRAPT